MIPQIQRKRLAFISTLPEHSFHVCYIGSIHHIKTGYSFNIWSVIKRIGKRIARNDFPVPADIKGRRICIEPCQHAFIAVCGIICRFHSCKIIIIQIDKGYGFKLGRCTDRRIPPKRLDQQRTSVVRRNHDRLYTFISLHRYSRIIVGKHVCFLVPVSRYGCFFGALIGNCRSLFRIRASDGLCLFSALIGRCCGFFFRTLAFHCLCIFCTLIDQYRFLCGIAYRRSRRTGK